MNGSCNFKKGEAKGASAHPHRGFETVTYVIDGAFEHKDSQGHSGKLDSGDVQWMTAGSGIVHSEMPEKEFVKKGGKLHGFQLWVNLPKKDKTIMPRYQEISSEKIPVVQSKDGKAQVKVIAGESMGGKAVIDTRTPIMYLHFRCNRELRLHKRFQVILTPLSTLHKDRACLDMKKNLQKKKRLYFLKTMVIR